VVSIIEGEHRRGAEHYGDATPAERLESEIWRVCPRITVPQMNAIKTAAARYGRAVVHLRGEPTRRDYAELTRPDDQATERDLAELQAVIQADLDAKIKRALG